jgi:hypothetical protein
MSRNGEITTINGAWSEEENAWVSDVWYLTGDCWLEVTLPGKGRIVIEKSETADGPWPKCLKSGWTGPEFRIRIYGSTKYRYVKIFLTETPERIQFSNTQGHAIQSQ